MPVYTTGQIRPEKTEPELPSRTRQYLATRVEAGARDNELFAAACQFRDAGFSQTEAEAQLIPCGVRDGFNEEYVRRRIKSAYSREARKPIETRNGAPCNHTSPGSGSPRSSSGSAKSASSQSGNTAWPPPEPLPDPIAEGARLFIETCFTDQEHVAIGQGYLDKHGEVAIDRGVTIRRKNLLEDLATKTVAELYPTKEGIFVRVNPMQMRGAADKEVSAYRNALTEFDLDKNGNRIPKEIQFSILVHSGFPIRAIMDSGNKSLQAIVQVDAKDRTEFDEHWKVLEAYFSQFDGFDAKNKNPSRYCRLPGVERNLYNGNHEVIGTGQQVLLALRIGPDCWAEWEKAHSEPVDARRDNLKRLLQPRSVGELPDVPPPQLISGILYQGGKMSFSGASKTFKTWNLFHLLFCMSHGLPYLGFTTARTFVLVFDFELIGYDCRWRLEKIAACYPNLPGDKFANLRIVTLRGRSVDFSDCLTQEVTTEVIKDSGAGAFAIDPLYKALGNHDEDKTVDVRRALKPFEQLTVDCNVAFLYNQHFSKGNQSGKNPMDRPSGSGTFARDPDVMLIFTPHSKPGCFTIDVIQRSFTEIKPFVVRWQFPIFVRDDSLDPGDLEPPKKVGRPKDTTADEKIMAALYGGENSGGLSTAQLCTATGYDRTTIWRRAKPLITKGEIIKSVTDKTYQLSSKNADQWAKIPKIDP